MEYTIRQLGEGDRQPVLDIYNYYIEHSFAAYREDKVGGENFGRALKGGGAYRQQLSVTVMALQALVC